MNLKFLDAGQMARFFHNVMFCDCVQVLSGQKPTEILSRVP